MKTTLVCSVRWCELTVDVFRVGHGSIVRYGGSLRGGFEQVAQPPEPRSDAWLRSIREVANLFGIGDGRYEWAPGEEHCDTCHTRIVDSLANGLGCPACAKKPHPAFCGCSDCPP